MEAAKNQVVVGPTYVCWKGSPRKKATNREWDLIRAALLLGQVRWQEGFIYFKSWRSRSQETSYIRQFQRVVAQVPEAVESGLRIQGVRLEHPDSDRSCWQFTKANPLHNSNLWAAAELARESFKSFKAGEFDDGWDQVRQSCDLYPCPRLLCPSIATASTAPPTLIRDKQWVARLLVPIEQHVQILTSAMCRVSTLAAAKQNDITPDNVGDALEQWIVELLNARMALTLLLSAGLTAKAGPIEPVEEFLRLASAYRRAKEVSAAPPEATPEALLQRLRGSDFVVDVVDDVSTFVEEIRHWRLDARDVAGTINSAIDSFLMHDPTLLPKETLYAHLYAHLLRMTRSNRRGRQVSEDIPDNSFEAKRRQLDALIQAYDSPASAIASAGFIAESILEGAPAQSSSKASKCEVSTRHRGARKSDGGSQPGQEAMANLRQWLLGHPRHGKLEILGQPIANWELCQDLPLLQEIENERLPREETIAEAREHDWCGVRLDRWEEEVLRERRTCGSPVAVDRLLEEFQHIVQESRGSRPETVLAAPRFVVLGPPGSGKSTLCQWLQWRAAEGRLVFQGKRLLPAYVRLVGWKADKMLDHLARQFEMSGGPTPAHWREWLEQGDVLLLLDGLDEVEAGSPVLARVQDALATYERCPTILTCRTVSRERYQEVCPDLPVFLLAGLERPQRDAYIEHFPGWHFDPQMLSEQLDRTPAMQPLAANPLLLAIICYVFEDGLKLPATRSKLYEEAVTRLLRRPLRNPASECRLALTQRRRILQEAAFQLFLAAGAERQLTFDEEALLEALVTAIQTIRGEEQAHDLAGRLLRDLLDRGILTGHDERGFAFLHPTIQEFLTAAEIGRRIEQDGWGGTFQAGGKTVTLRQLVDAKAWAPAWQEVIALLAGRLSNPAPLLKMLSNPGPTPTNPDGDDVFRHRLALAALCLPEIPKDRRTKCASLFDRITADAFGLWLEHEAKLTSPAVEDLTRALPALAAVNGNYQGQPLLEWLAKTLPENAAACSALAAMGDVAATPAVLGGLLDAMRTPESTSRSAVTEAVGSLGTKAATPEILSELIESLRDEDHGVLGEAAKAIGRIVAPAVTPELRSRLIELSRDERHHVRRKAVEAIGRIGTPAASPEILSRLVELLRDKDHGVLREAVEAIGRIGTPAATPEILARLVELSRDERRDVRMKAATTICRIGERAATPEILSGLVELLHDKDSWVQAEAAEAIGLIGAPAALPEILSRLAELLGDKEDHVRRGAAMGAGEIGAPAAVPEILSRLAELLADKDNHVRGSAALAVGKIWPPAAIHEILSGLTALLHDRCPWVRSSAAVAVGKIGPPAATPEILFGLAALLHDKDANVRWAAAKAAGGIGERAATPEILSGLVKLLCDESAQGRSEVENAVAEAARAVGRIGTQAATPQILARLSHLLAPVPGTKRFLVIFVAGIGAGMLMNRGLRFFPDRTGWRKIELADLTACS